VRTEQQKQPFVTENNTDLSFWEDNTRDNYLGEEIIFKKKLKKSSITR
jgi:hypothetical protein